MSEVFKFIGDYVPKKRHLSDSYKKKKSQNLHYNMWTHDVWPKVYEIIFGQTRYRISYMCGY